VEPIQRFALPVVVFGGGGKRDQDDRLASGTAAEASERHSVFPDGPGDSIQEFAVFTGAGMLPDFGPHQEMAGKTVAPAGPKICGASAHRPYHGFPERNGRVAKLPDHWKCSFGEATRIGGKNLAGNAVSEAEPLVGTNVSAGFCPSEPYVSVTQIGKLGLNPS